MLLSYFLAFLASFKATFRANSLPSPQSVQEKLQLASHFHNMHESTYIYPMAPSYIHSHLTATSTREKPRGDRHRGLRPELRAAAGCLSAALAAARSAPPRLGCSVKDGNKEVWRTKRVQVEEGRYQNGAWTHDFGEMPLRLPIERCKTIRVPFL